MLSALLKKQLQEIFRSYFYNAKQGKAAPVPRHWVILPSSPC